MDAVYTIKSDLKALAEQDRAVRDGLADTLESKLCPFNCGLEFFEQNPYRMHMKSHHKNHYQVSIG